MSTTPTPTLAIRADRVSWRIVDGEAILLDLAASEYLALNRIATELWQLLDAGTDESGLAEAMVARYGVDRDTARADVAEFVALCRRHHFVA